MFDIGMMEMLVVGVLALVVVGPKELPKLLRTIGGLYRKLREMTAEFREGVQSLAAEAERELDPFEDLRKSEGIHPGMSPEEITDHILANKKADASPDQAKKKAVQASNSDVSISTASPKEAPNPDQEQTKTPKGPKS